MLDKTKTIETLKSTRQYLDEHYGVRSMLLFGSLARGEQHEMEFESTEKSESF